MSDHQPPSASDLPSSWQDEDEDAIRTEGKSRKVWVFGGIAVVLLVIVGVIAVINLGGPEERAWPAALDGRPEGLGGEKETAAEVTPSAEPGVYIWNSFDGWHLWIVNGEGLDGLTGSITSNDDIVSASSSNPDAGTASVDDKKITFDLDGGDALAGVDFDPGFAKKLTFDLETADGEVSADLVFTGAKSAPVSSIPLVVDKEVVDG